MRGNLLSFVVTLILVLATASPPNEHNTLVWKRPPTSVTDWTEFNRAENLYVKSLQSVKDLQNLQQLLWQRPGIDKKRFNLLIIGEKVNQSIMEELLFALLTADVLKIGFDELLIRAQWELQDFDAVFGGYGDIRKGLSGVYLPAVEVNRPETARRLFEYLKMDSGGRLQVLVTGVRVLVERGLDGQARVQRQDEYESNQLEEARQLISTATLINNNNREIGVDDKLPGLGNLGNTCYLNSALQVLFHIPLFRERLLSLSQMQSGSVTLALHNLFGLMKMISGQRERQASINPRVFLQVVREAFYMNVHEQNHADEFLEWLIGRVIEESSNNYFKQLFQLKTQQVISVLDSNHLSETEETFIGIKTAIKEQANLEDLLALYFQPEILQKDSKYKVEGQGYFDAVKSMNIKSVPEILFINLKRLARTRSGTIAKLSTRIQIPEQIDLRDAGLVLQSEQTTRYQLKGVIIHLGGSKSGHYISFVNVGQTDGIDRWFLFNDANVQERPVEYLHTDEVERNADVLIYAKI